MEWGCGCPSVVVLSNCVLLYLSHVFKQALNLHSSTTSHISSVLKKANKRIYHIGACKKAHLPDEVGLTTYTTKIRPLLEYACPVWGGIPEYLSRELQRVQDPCLKILRLPKDAHETLASRRSNLTKNELERMMRSDTFKHLFRQSDHDYNLRHKKCNQVPLSHTVRHQQSFVPRALGL